jgi:hypothetical protein
MRYDDGIPDLTPEQFWEREMNDRMARTAEAMAMSTRPPPPPPTRRVVRDLGSGRLYDSIIAAAAAIGAKPAALSNAIRRQGTCRKRRFRWELI